MSDDDATIENEYVEIEIERSGFEQAPNELFMPYDGDPDAPRLAYVDVNLYLILRHFGATKGYRISRAKIAKALGCTPRYVTERAKKLSEAGWLLITPTYRDKGDMGRSSNSYVVLWRRIKSPQDPRAVAHAERLKKVEADRVERKRARHSGGTPPMLP